MGSPAGRLGRWLHGAVAPRTTGFPTSSNRASSFHLAWGGLPPGDDLIAVSVQLEIVDAPAVPQLYFWALQTSFADGGRRFGAGHLGLQWYPAHPGSTAVNWGGYDAAGRELPGSASPLPSATGNPNTRDFSWRPHQPYRLTVQRDRRAGGWLGSVDDDPVRTLQAGGRHLTDVLVWSEVFARCDDPTVVVRWSDFAAVTATGRTVRPDRLVTSFQSKSDGGCDNTSVTVAGGVAEQSTNVDRAVRSGAVLPL